eukprot:gene13344-23438_t
MHIKHPLPGNTIQITGQFFYNGDCTLDSSAFTNILPTSGAVTIFNAPLQARTRVTNKMGTPTLSGERASRTNRGDYREVCKGKLTRE